MTRHLMPEILIRALQSGNMQVIQWYLTQKLTLVRVFDISCEPAMLRFFLLALVELSICKI